MITRVCRDDRWTRPAYPAAEAGRLVGLTPSRVRRWLQGYRYRYGDGVRDQRPIVRGPRTRNASYASFLDLMDLLFVKGFLDEGVSLQKVRRALDEAHEILGTSHFARQTFFTDGANIYLEVQERGEAILELLSGGQWVIAPVIRQLAEEIDFASPEGLARRWYPLGRSRPIVLDPFVSFGAPSVVGRGVKTANIHDLFLAENESSAAVREGTRSRSVLHGWKEPQSMRTHSAARAQLAADEGAGSQDSSALRISDPALRHEVQTPAVELTR